MWHGIRDHVDAERRRVAAVALRADAEAVGARRAAPARGASSMGSGFGLPISRNSAFLDRIAAFSKVPPMPTPRISGGQASGPAVFTHSMMKSFTRRQPGRRREHRVLRAVLAAAALGHDHELELGARRDVDVDHGRRVVAGVHAVERRLHDRGAQVAFLVALAHALVDGVLQPAARHVHVLAQLDEADDHAGVLAVRDAPGPRQLGVVLEDLQHLLAGRRALGAERPVEGAQHVGLEADVGLHAELLDGVGDGADVDVAHQALPCPWAIAAIAALARSAICLGGTSSLCVAMPHWLP